MLPSDLKDVVLKGMQAMEEGNTMMALLLFRDAAVLHPTPVILSSYGYCLVMEHQQFQKGTTLCLEAMQKDSHNPLHYLHLGRIYLLANRKPLAIQTFRKGLRVARDPRLIEELRLLGLRRQPVFSGLDRNHVLNRYCGILLSRLGLR